MVWRWQRAAGGASIARRGDANPHDDDPHDAPATLAPRAAGLRGLRAIDDDGNVDTAVEGLTGAARRPRLQRIRDVAAEGGSPTARSSRASRRWRRGCRTAGRRRPGRAAAQLDELRRRPGDRGRIRRPVLRAAGWPGDVPVRRGTFSQTLARDGRDILTLDGNIRHAVDFVVNIVRQEVSGVNTRAEALAWMNGITIARGNARFERWVAILACRYNGACGSASQAGGTATRRSRWYGEVGAAFWHICTPTREVCNGRDDDCDGRVDDGIAAVSCGVGACRRTVTCAGGRMAACTPGVARAEVCGNAADDDCDGMTDEAARATRDGRPRRQRPGRRRRRSAGSRRTPRWQPTRGRPRMRARAMTRARPRMRATTRAPRRTSRWRTTPARAPRTTVASRRPTPSCRRAR